VAGTEEIMNWIGRKLDPETYVNLMAQYHSAGRVADTEYPEINRCVSSSEVERAIGKFHSAALTRLDREPTFVQS
jgi:putative pyruvate formate lyase activating enzyme